MSEETKVKQNFAERSDIPKKPDAKKWGVIGGIIVILIAFTVGVSIYNSPSNRLSRQLDLGQRYLEEQNYEQAVVEFDKAIEIDPMSVEAYLGKAQAYEGMGDFDMAIQTLQEGYERTGDDRLRTAMDSLDYVIEWEDAAFEALIREYLGKTEGDIRWSDVRDIDSINIWGIYILMSDEQTIGTGITGIRYMDGNAQSYSFVTEKREILHETIWGKIETLNDIKHFAGIRSLVIQCNNISDISGLSDRMSLNKVMLRCNNISDISALSNLINLENLVLDGNNISDIIALSNLTNLEHVQLDYNNISDISVLSNLTNLEIVSLGDNNISDISVLSNLTNLKYLDLKDNSISDISVLSGLTKLSRVYLQGNPITDYSPVSFVDDVRY